MAPYNNDAILAAEGGILMSSVNFRYRPDLPLVLQDISVQVVGGTKVNLILKWKSCPSRDRTQVGIVGRTAAGKSSLISTLLRMVELHSGSIIVDDVIQNDWATELTGPIFAGEHQRDRAGGPEICNRCHPPGPRPLPRHHQVNWRPEVFSKTESFQVQHWPFWCTHGWGGVESHWAGKSEEEGSGNQIIFHNILGPKGDPSWASKARKHFSVTLHAFVKNEVWGCYRLFPTDDECGGRGGELLCWGETAALLGQGSPQEVFSLQF